jgi:hypothetical protein
MEVSKDAKRRAVLNITCTFARATFYVLTGMLIEFAGLMFGSYLLDWFAQRYPQDLAQTNRLVIGVILITTFWLGYFIYHAYRILKD